jgi:hypothetical protein
MVELKPRKDSSKFNGKIRHNQEPLFDDEFKQLVVITKTEKKEEQLLFIFNLLKIKPSVERTATATPERARLDKNVSVVKAFVSKIENEQKKPATDKQVLEVIEKCPDKLMQEALIKHFCLVVPKPEEWTFV